MITLTDYGGKLEQLRQDKIELVRKWRNSDTFQIGLDMSLTIEKILIHDFSYNLLAA